MAGEADIHFELYRHLQNVIEENPRYRDLTYGRAEPEVNVDHGFADIVVRDNRDRPVVVIEAKRLEGGRIRRDIDPYSPVVIRQAFDYAGLLGADYFATYNGRHLVLFQTFERGTHLLDRRTRAYEVLDPAAFAGEFLGEIADLRAGRANWDVAHRAFIKRLRVYHERLAREFQTSLLASLPHDQLRQLLDNWIRQQGWQNDRRDEVHGRFVSQAAYLLMNKLVFLKLLEDSTTYQVPCIRMEDLADPGNRRETFDRLMREFDFEAVYQSDPIFDALPLTPVAADETREFLEGLSSFDLSRFDHDVIGQVYQHVIPPEERHDLGQYYTPPEVVELMTRLTVVSGDDKVMDPACGSGGFLVAAYKRLRDLKGRAGTHQGTLSQIIGYDINRFPAHLSAINLALQDLNSRTQKVNIDVIDFFNVTPGQSRITFLAPGVPGESRAFEEAYVADVVVANPPYIRQEQIPSKERCRAHLAQVGADHISTSSDIFVYFFTHATEFLRPGGRLAFITSDRWLSVRYGEGLQRFFLENYKIRAIVNFSRQLFTLALISTCVVVLERCHDAQSRDDNVVSFLQLREPKPSDEIIDLVNAQREPDMLHDEPAYRLVTLKQGTLRDETKWDRYIRAPRVYWDVLTNPALTTLETVAEIERGMTAGANDFFYFRNEQEWRDRGIPAELVRPLLKHVAETSYVELRPEDLEWFILDLHGFVARALRRTEGRNTVAAVKRALTRAGHQSVVDYIEWGEAQGLPARPSLRGRPIWFDLGSLDVPSLVLSEVYWRECPTLVNRANAVVDKRLYALRPRDGVDPTVLGGILNSSLYRLMREMHGRIEQGEAMNRNTIMVYEACRLPVPDPRRLDRGQATAIGDAFERLLACERVAPAEERVALAHALDTSVAGALGMQDRVAEIDQAVLALLGAREAGAHQNVGVLVSPGPVDYSLAGARRVAGESRPEQMPLFGHEQ